MKALLIESPGVVSLCERAVPEPNADEVLIRVRRAGFCGSDLSTFRGANPLAAYPRIPGHELAGTIEVVGKNVPSKWSVGQDVLVVPYTSCGVCSACRQGRPNCCRSNQTLGVQRDGGLCEYLAVPWEKLMTHASLGLAELALVEPLTVGFHAVARGRVESEEHVVVMGCGAIGLGVIAGAAARGACVMAVDLDGSKRSLALAAGAGFFHDPSCGDLAQTVQDFTGGQGADVVIEAIGQSATFRAAVDLACFGGRVVYIGYTKTPVEYDSRLFVQKEIDILGSRNAMPEDFQNVIRHLVSGRFPVNSVISKVESLSNSPAALAEWSAHPQAVTKIQIDLDL